MKYLLVIQFKEYDGFGFERLVAIEKDFRNITNGIALCDGHDYGNGEMNLFLFTDNPSKVFGVLFEYLEKSKLLECMKAAFRDTDCEEYEILWPSGCASFKIT